MLDYLALHNIIHDANTEDKLENITQYLRKLDPLRYNYFTGLLYNECGRRTYMEIIPCLLLISALYLMIL
jgi:hypothetical protein